MPATASAALAATAIDFELSLNSIATLKRSLNDLACAGEMGAITGEPSAAVAPPLAVVSVMCSVSACSRSSTRSTSSRLCSCSWKSSSPKAPTCFSANAAFRRSASSSSSFPVAVPCLSTLGKPPTESLLSNDVLRFAVRTTCDMDLRAWWTSTSASVTNLDNSCTFARNSRFFVSCALHFSVVLLLAASSFRCFTAWTFCALDLLRLAN
mmetsp:Transcript_151828/g.487221  ORF Transcript_151828/g.487221 Transcript_151828/m.487221 type:complete len:210 (-) Transcript_151828:568-1197(-)